jgi:hypothetical protein
MLGTAERTRRKHLLRLAVAKGDTVAAEKLRAQLHPRPVPQATPVWGLAGKIAVILLIRLLVALLQEVVFEGVQYLLGVLASIIHSPSYLLVSRGRNW